MQNTSPISRRKLRPIEQNTSNDVTSQLFKNKSQKTLHNGSEILAFASPNSSSFKKQASLGDSVTSPNFKLSGIKDLKPINNYSPKKRTMSSIRGSIQPGLDKLYDHQTDRKIKLNVTSETEQLKHGQEAYRSPLNDNKKSGIEPMRIYPLENKGFKVTAQETDISPLAVSRTIFTNERRTPGDKDKRLYKNSSSPFINSAKGNILNSGYQSPILDIPMTTTHRSEYKPWESNVIKHKGREQNIVIDGGIFSGRTSYNSSYLNYGSSPKVQLQQPNQQGTAIPDLPFLGQSNYKQNFVKYHDSKPAHKKEQHIKSPFSMGVPLVLESSNSRMFKPFVMGANSKFEEGKDDFQPSESFLNQFQAANSRVFDSSIDMKNMA